MKESGRNAATMEGGEVCKTLPVELVERIISMVPYPSIFKARCLSRSWLARLLSICREEDEGEQRRLASFHNLVRERSKGWPIYSPVLVNDVGSVIGRHEGSNIWHDLPSLSFLPLARFIHTFGRGNLLLQVEGALLLVSKFHYLANVGRVYVGNILTRTWKRLPPLPTTLSRIFAVKLLVVDESSDAYKVLLLYETERDVEDDEDDYCWFAIYDSRSDSWSTGKKTAEGSVIVRRELANLVEYKGVLYIVADCNPPKLWAFHLGGGPVEELELSIGDDFDYPSDADLDYHLLAVCGADLVMVYYDANDLIYALKVDLQTMTLVPLAKVHFPCPALDGTGWFSELSVTDGHNIYVGTGRERNNPILKYETGSDTWSSLHPSCTDRAMTRICFQPGSGTFMAV